jgi:hypothetical protein
VGRLYGSRGQLLYCEDMQALTMKLRDGLLESWDERWGGGRGCVETDRTDSQL